MIDNSLDEVTRKPEIKPKINHEKVHKGTDGRLIERITTFVNEKPSKARKSSVFEGKKKKWKRREN